MSSSLPRRTITVVATLLLLAGAAGCADLTVDVPDAEKDGLGAYVESGGRIDDTTPIDFNPGATTAFTTLDHLAWDATLRRYIKDGRVAYSDFRASSSSRELMEDYLQMLAEADPDALESDEERLAFWMNAYNAIVFFYAAENLEATPGFSVSDDDFIFFKQQRYPVGGELYSLDQIEHGVIRGDRAHASVADLSEDAWATFASRHEAIFGADGPDARIHVGLNCASFSCPALPSYAYTASSVQTQLDTQSADFVNDAARGAGPDGVTMLFTWFKPDFDASYGSPRGFVEAFRDDVDAVNFETSLEYDWSLNGE